MKIWVKFNTGFQLCPPDFNFAPPPPPPDLAMLATPLTQPNDFHGDGVNVKTPEDFRSYNRDGAENKKCISMLCCVRKPCPHAAPHCIQTQLS